MRASGKQAPESCIQGKQVSEAEYIHPSVRGKGNRLREGKVRVCTNLESSPAAHCLLLAVSPLLLHLSANPPSSSRTPPWFVHPHLLACKLTSHRYEETSLIRASLSSSSFNVPPYSPALLLCSTLLCLLFSTLLSFLCLDAPLLYSTLSLCSASCCLFYFTIDSTMASSSCITSDYDPKTDLAWNGNREDPG
jgi:hypothetical protein